MKTERLIQHNSKINQDNSHLKKETTHTQKQNAFYFLFTVHCVSAGFSPAPSLLSL